MSMSLSTTSATTSTYCFRFSQPSDFAAIKRFYVENTDSTMINYIPDARLFAQVAGQEYYLMLSETGEILFISRITFDKKSTRPLLRHSSQQLILKPEEKHVDIDEIFSRDDILYLYIGSIVTRKDFRGKKLINIFLENATKVFKKEILKRLDTGKFTQFYLIYGIYFSTYAEKVWPIYVQGAKMALQIIFNDTQHTDFKDYFYLLRNDKSMFAIHGRFINKTPSTTIIQSKL